MEVLVTGGAGYIGSHTCVELLNKGYDVIVIDNLSNSNPESLNRVQALTGKTLKFYEGDVRDEALLTKIFEENKPECVIHFAGLKAVGESVEKPWLYYNNNLNSTLVLTKVMEKVGMKQEGVLRSRLYNKGRFVDVALYAILRCDWRRQA